MKDTEIYKLVDDQRKSLVVVLYVLVAICFQFCLLQKVPPEQLKKAKNDMEQGFQVNCVKPGDKEWRYDVRIDFEASEENEWDEFDEDSFHSNRKSESPRRKQNGTEEAAKTEENDTTQGSSQ